MAHEHTETIRSLFTAKGYGEDKLNALATLLHITGYDDGIIKPAPDPTQILSVLERPITKEAFNARLQENYFKKYRGTGERQQIKNSEELAPHRKTIVSLFNTLGFITPVAPSKEEYDIAFVFGCAQVGLEGRFKELIGLQNGTLVAAAGAGAGSGSAEDIVRSAITIKDIFILAGDRPLWPDKENIAALLFAQRAGVTQGIIQEKIDAIFTPEVRDRNEAEEITAKRLETVASLKAEYPSAAWPTESDMAGELASTMLPGQSVVIVDARGRGGKRPDTLDTINAWNERYGDRITTEKSIIAISNQPFVQEQSVFLGLLDPSKLSFEVVGNGCNPDKTNPELLLPSLAVCFSRELQLEKFKKIAMEEKSKEGGAVGRG